jgi:hypothetical protein
MPIKSKLTGTGTAPANAQMIAGTVISSEAGAGTTTADATVLSLDDIHYIATAANNSGVKLPATLSAGDSMLIFNADANTLLLYPPTGGELNNGTVTTGTVSIATHTSARATCVNSLDFIVESATT